MTNKKVCILDYGSGNTRSVFNVFTTLTPNVLISNKSADIKNASHIILPGVGAFGASMEKIKNKIPLDTLEHEIIKRSKPFLGICVGMQVLADYGYEFGKHKGLGWISGTVEKIKIKNLILPHVGWNNIDIVRQIPLLDKFKNKQDFYFLHSFIFREKNKKNIAAKTNYGENFNSVIFKNNIFGVQFHPEKSQKVGRVLIENFLNIV